MHFPSSTLLVSEIENFVSKRHVSHNISKTLHEVSMNFFKITDFFCFQNKGTVSIVHLNTSSNQNKGN